MRKLTHSIVTCNEMDKMCISMARFTCSVRKVFTRFASYFYFPSRVWFTSIEIQWIKEYNNYESKTYRITCGIKYVPNYINECVLSSLKTLPCYSRLDMKCVQCNNCLGLRLPSLQTFFLLRFCLKWDKQRRKFIFIKRDRTVPLN